MDNEQAAVPDRYSSDRLTISLLIGNETYKVTVPREQESLFRRAAKQINDQIAYYEVHYPSQPKSRYISTVLLDLAVNQLKQRDRNELEPFMASIGKLTEELDAVLK